MTDRPGAAASRGSSCVARVSLDIARTLARICRRRRSTSARLARVSARLPPVSRCTLSAMMKKRNSGASMRLAMSHSSASRSRPEPHAGSRPGRSSSPTGSPISRPAPMIASLIGRPERSARTIRSMASGNRRIKAATRRFPMRPTTMCGSAIPISEPDQQARNEAEPGEARSGRASTSAPCRRSSVAYWPMVMVRPVRARRAASNSRRGSQRRATRSILGWRSAAAPATGARHRRRPVSLWLGRAPRQAAALASLRRAADRRGDQAKVVAAARRITRSAIDYVKAQLISRNRSKRPEAANAVGAEGLRPGDHRRALLMTLPTAAADRTRHGPRLRDRLR